MKVKPTLIIHRIICYIVLVFFSILCLFFFYILLVNASRSHYDIMSGFSFLPGNQFIYYFQSAISNSTFPVVNGVSYSLIIATCTAILSIYFSAMTAYSIHVYDFKGKKFIFNFILLIMTIPTQVSALGFVEMMDAWGIKDSFIPLIFPTLASPAVFFFIKQYMESSLPLEIVEAGRIDGGHEYYIFNFVVMPILKPALAVQMIFQFVASWNNYFLPQLLMDNSSENATLPLVVASLQAEAYLTDLGEIYMILGFAIIPLIVVYLCLSKFIIRGVALGSVKG